MKISDLVRLRKSHPAAKRWRREFQKRGAPFIGRWAEEGTPLLLLRRADYDNDRWEVLGPGGQLGSFDEFLFTTRGMK